MGEGSEVGALACSRCGTFVGEAEVVRHDQGTAYCPACAARPEVQLAGFRERCLGRRDGWVWLVLLMGVGAVGGAVGALQAQRRELVAAWLALAVTAVLFFAGVRIARLLLVPAVVLVQVATLAITGAVADPVQLPAQIGGLVPSVVMAAVAVFNPRTKLFFGLDISPAALQRTWEIYGNNPAARLGFSLGLLSLVFWPLAVAALPLSLVGLRRVNPAGSPPVGRRRQAIAGIVSSSLGLLILLVVGVMFWRDASR